MKTWMAVQFRRLEGVFAVMLTETEIKPYFDEKRELPQSSRKYFDYLMDH